MTTAPTPKSDQPKGDQRRLLSMRQASPWPGIDDINISIVVTVTDRDREVWGRLIEKAIERSADDYTREQALKGMFLALGETVFEDQLYEALSHNRGVLPL